MSSRETAPASRKRQRLETLAAASARRGRELLHLDLAAALASDRGRRVFADLVTSRVTSWIVDIGQHGHEVVFLNGDDPPRVLLQITFSADGLPISDQLDEMATPRQQLIAAAKRTALAARSDPRSSLYNAFVVPPPHDPLPDAPIDVYLLRRASWPGDVVLGVHWHMRVSSDGLRLLEARALSETECTLPGSHGRPPVDIAVTHTLAETPSEIHAYLSSKHDRPIDVVTPSSNAQWRVSAGGVTLLGFTPVDSE
jgi:hypothetical protein